MVETLRRTRATPGSTADIVTIPRQPVPITGWRTVWRRLRRHRLAVIGLVALTLVALFAFVGPALWPYEAGRIYAEGRQIVDGHRVDAPSLHAPAPRCTDGGGRGAIPERFAGDPCAPHLLGTDSAGRDMVAQLMRGTQRSLVIAFAAAAGSTFVGVVVGALAGYHRGWIDAILIRGTDLFLTVPAIAVAGTLSHHVQGGRWWVLPIILAGLGWMFIARLVRAEVLSLREREFVEAARAVGLGDARIIVRHILPNVVGSIVVSATLVVAASILTETALSYLGLGVTSPDTSLGQLVSANQAGFQTRPWLFWSPGSSSSPWPCRSASSATGCATPSTPGGRGGARAPGARSRRRARPRGPSNGRRRAAPRASRPRACRARPAPRRPARRGIPPRRPRSRRGP